MSMYVESTLHELHGAIIRAQERLAASLRPVVAAGGPTLDQYTRFLSVQYHLTKDVQRCLLAVAAHSDLMRRRALRDVLCRLANAEELHHLVAAKDLRHLNVLPMAMPFDVELWHSYFRSIAFERPFVRLGAACIVATIAGGPARPLVRRVLRARFLTRENTTFMLLPRIECGPRELHLLSALADADLNRLHIEDLLEGAKKATLLFLRMIEWACDAEGATALEDRRYHGLSFVDELRIAGFDMADLA